MIGAQDTIQCADCWCRIVWNSRKWNGMEWNGMEWNNVSNKKNGNMLVQCLSQCLQVVVTQIFVAWTEEISEDV